ncbi:LLM class F420-dependent oxidoreductase [Nocardia sp. NPDC055029]
MPGLGLTIPLDGLSLSQQNTTLDLIQSAGYTDLWSSEISGADAFTPLVAAAVSHPTFQLGTAIVPAYTRSPALMAMSIAALADVADAEVSLGIGSSSDVIIERWNGIEFREPYQRVRDVAVFVRRALTGERIDMTCDSFAISGFQLDRVPARQPKLLLAALRPKMLRLAASISDGAIVNWLSPSDVTTIVPYLRSVNPDAAIVARLFVIPSDDLDTVRNVAKRAIAAYLNVPVYAEFHRWLGRSDQLAPMWAAWRAGDRAGALAAIPDALVEDLFLFGSPTDISARIQDYVRAGVTMPVLALLPVPGVQNTTATITAIGRSYTPHM